MPSNEERLATLEATRHANEQFQRDVYSYMEKGSDYRDQTSRDITRLVVIQEAMTQYQVKCDADRVKIANDVANVDKRVTITEGYQKRQVKYASVACMLGGAAGISGAKICEKIIALFV